jgi:hypothetical protein
MYEQAILTLPTLQWAVNRQTSRASRVASELTRGPYPVGRGSGVAWGRRQ